jgi:hypothetical protein
MESNLCPGVSKTCGKCVLTLLLASQIFKFAIANLYKTSHLSAWTHFRLQSITAKKLEYKSRDLHTAQPLSIYSGTHAEDS